MPNIREEKRMKPGIKSPGVNRLVPYGITPLSIALGIKAETGTDQTVDELDNQCKQMVKAWKEDTYVTAWKYMTWCGAQVKEPGYLVNPWGRYRRFPRSYLPRDLPGMERQAQNFPE